MPWSHHHVKPSRLSHARLILRGKGIDVSGTCRWTGYDFPVITIDTGYLNRPNWLLAGYSVYYRVASQPGSQPTMFMSGPRSRPAPGTVRAGRNRFLWMYDDTQQNRESVCTSTNEPWINAWSRNYAWKFLVRYNDRVYFLCAERFETGSGFPPPPPPAARPRHRQYGSAPPHPQRHVPVTVNMEVPPPPRRQPRRPRNRHDIATSYSIFEKINYVALTGRALTCTCDCGVTLLLHGVANIERAAEISFCIEPRKHRLRKSTPSPAEGIRFR